jgi:hypothetical protein
VILHTTVGKKKVAASRKASKGLMIGAAVLAGFAVFNAWRHWSGFTSIAESHFLVFAIAVALGTMGLLLYRNNSPKHARKSGRALIRSVGAYALRQPHAITLSPNGFRFEGGGQVTEMAWRHFEEVTRGDQFLLLVRHDATAHVVPRRIAGSDAAQQELVGLCNQWIKDDGGGAAYAVAALLFERDLPCPKCQYNLRGQTRPLCPECGSTLDQHDLYTQILQTQTK